MKKLIELYTKYLGNLEYNLNTNRDFLSAKEVAVLEQRIKDFKQFIEHVQYYCTL